MAELSVGIAGYAAFDPGSRDAATISRAIDHGLEADQTARPVPMMLRRRVSAIGQAALRAAWSLPRVDDATYVFASRHGEFDRTLTMLQQVADADGPSPADFSLGVHNALAGLLSVATKNSAGHTALAAGVDSFGFGLMEAAACVNEHPECPAILVYYDTGLPPGYPDATLAAPESTLALAISLVPPNAAKRRIAMAAAPANRGEPIAEAAAIFLRFLRTNAPEAAAAGERMRWTWRHV